jgi:uncharacterized protein
MTLEYFFILLVIAALSVVQSVFGMGVLLFGTPTLLLMGYDFTTTLSYLLPASFAISLLQVLTAGSDRVEVSNYLYFLCLPGIVVGLWFADSRLEASWTNILIGATLLFSALVRFWPRMQRLLAVALDRYFPIYHLIMGTVHGLTNLGGAMLAVLVSGTQTEKNAVRYTVAHYYLAFSTIQMLLLATVIGRFDALLANLPAAVTSAAVYLLVGNRIFARTNNPAYNFALTVFIAVYGVVVLFMS